MKRIPGGRIDFHAPPEQHHYIPEVHHVYRQRVINTHYGPDQHVVNGQAPNAQVYLDPSTVHVHQQAPQVHRHVPKQSFLGALFAGPAKQPAQPQRQALPAPQYQAPPPQYQALPAPQAVNRGQLHAIPAPQQQMPQRAPTALPAPQGQPMAMPMMAPQRKKAGWW